MNIHLIKEKEEITCKTCHIKNRTTEYRVYDTVFSLESDNNESFDSDIVMDIAKRFLDQIFQADVFPHCEEMSSSINPVEHLKVIYKGENEYFICVSLMKSPKKDYLLNIMFSDGEFAFDNYAPDRKLITMEELNLQTHNPYPLKNLSEEERFTMEDHLRYIDQTTNYNYNHYGEGNQVFSKFRLNNSKYLAICVTENKNLCFIGNDWHRSQIHYKVSLNNQNTVLIVSDQETLVVQNRPHRTLRTNRELVVCYNKQTETYYIKTNLPHVKFNIYTDDTREKVFSTGILIDRDLLGI